MSDLAAALAWKYGPVADTADDEITAWRHPTEPWPTDADIDALMAEYEPVRQAREDAQMRAHQRRDRIRSEIGDRSELIDLAESAAIAAAVRDLRAIVQTLRDAFPALSLTTDNIDALPQRYRRVLQRLETIALDQSLWPGDEDDQQALRGGR